MSKRWRRVGWFVIGAAATGLLVAVVYALLQGAQSSQSSEDLIQAVRDTQVSNHQLLDTVNDCVKPTGKCFARSQKQAAKFGTSLGRHEIATAACQIGISRQSTAATPQELNRQIAACVSETLAQLDRQRAAGR